MKNFARNVPADAASRVGAVAAAPFAAAPLARMLNRPTGGSAPTTPAVTRRLGL